MRNMSLPRKSILASGVMMAFAALPFSLAMAQSTSPSSTMPQEQQATQQMQQPSSTTSSTSATPSSNETVPGKVDDTWITTKVKSKLATAKGVKSSDISVSTTDGVVTLTGTATSTKEKNHVEHLAKQVKGVKSVDATGLAVTATSTKSNSMPSNSSG